MTFGHVAGAMHEVLVASGGTPRTARITPDAAALAKRYGTQIAVCPARRAQREGLVEAALKYLTKPRSAAGLGGLARH